MQSYSVITALVLFSLMCYVSAEDAEQPTENVNVEEKKLDYAKGSLCQYCDYCKFCKLCDADCPCETSTKKPNCKMCKYCKFCYVCKACDAVCKPGGILDTVTAALVNALPTFNKGEVDSDIDSVKHWIDNAKEEL